MGRDSRPGAQDTGRMGFRYPAEPHDERPVIVYREPFWKDEDERFAYERAVRLCPLSQYGHLDVFAYLREVGEVATGLEPGRVVQPMPHVHLSRRERDEQLDKLRKQEGSL